MRNAKQLLEEFEEVRSKIEEYKKRESEREGARQTILKMVKDKFGYRKENEIRGALENDMNELNLKCKQLERMLDVFMNNWKMQLKEIERNEQS